MFVVKELRRSHKISEAFCIFGKLMNKRMHNALDQNFQQNTDLNLLKDSTILINELKSILKCPEQIAKHIAVSYPELNKMKREDLHENLVILYGQRFKNSSIYNNPQLLNIPSVSLYNYALILEESSIRKSIRNLFKLNSYNYLDVPISLLKAYRLIKDNVNVLVKLLSYVPELPVSLRPMLVDERKSLNDLYVCVAKAYLKWKLNLKEEDLELIRRTNLKNLSLQMMKMNLLFLLDEVKFSSTMILDNFYIIKKMYVPLLIAQKDVFSSKNIDYTSLCQKYPKLFTISISQINEVLKLLEDFGVPLSSVLNCPQIFSMPTSIIKENLITVSNIKELNAMKINSRFLEVVVNTNDVLYRLNAYKKLKVNKISISSLVDKFYLKENVIISPSFNRVGNFDLLEHISKKINYPEGEIRLKLMRHPYWLTISLVQVEETLTWLQLQNFSNKEIFESIQLVLYPKVRVEMELLLLNKRKYEESSLYNETGDRTIKKEFILPLALYFIEKSSQFAGDAVWLDSLLHSSNNSDIHDEDDADVTTDVVEPELAKEIGQNEKIQGEEREQVEKNNILEENIEKNSSDNSDTHQDYLHSKNNAVNVN